MQSLCCSRGNPLSSLEILQPACSDTGPVQQGRGNPVGGGELAAVLEISALDHYLMRSDSPLWKPNIDNIDDNIGGTIDNNIEDKKDVK